MRLEWILDGEPWNNPPSMGCNEVVLSNLVGSLGLKYFGQFDQYVCGPPCRVFRNYHWSCVLGLMELWRWSDGFQYWSERHHAWTESGNYPVTFTAYNNDNPSGVSTSIAVQVLSLNLPQLQPAGVVAGAFQFQFIGQTNANYTIQYTTNLSQPELWQTLQTITANQGGIIQINDSALTNQTRFYRVLAQ